MLINLTGDENEILREKLKKNQTPLVFIRRVGTHEWKLLRKWSQGISPRTADTKGITISYKIILSFVICIYVLGFS